MKGLNKAELIGNLGAEPEMRYTPAGIPVTTFNLATSRKFKDNTGQMQEETTWHRIVAWNNLAEICNQYLKKGSKVYLDGRISNRSWEDNAGVKHYASEIVAGSMIFLDDKPVNEPAPAIAGSDTQEELPF